MATTSVSHEIGGVSSSEEERRFYAPHVNPMENNFMVLKVAPPLTPSEAQLDHCVESIRRVVETVHSSKVFWIDALNLGRRAMSL
jgi:hypothetical protein